MAEVTLSADAKRAFAAVEDLCKRLGIAIVAPEHVLAAALMTLAEHGVAWSPDSKALAFFSGRDQSTATPGQVRQRQLFVVDADGDGLRKVTDETKPVAGTPQWQPR